MKRTLVCFILGCLSLCPAQEFSPRLGNSVNVQRLFKFSGTLTDRQRGFTGSAVALHFMMYSEPSGGAACWQETQNVQADAQGRYTVLLGDTTPGGLPADVVTPGAVHWLGVQGSGQPEQPRILLVELPSTLNSEAMGSRASVSASALRPRRRERYVTLLLLMMFLVGTGLAYLEALRWWKVRLGRYEPPPLANLIRYAPGPERRWRPTQVLWFPLSHLRTIGGRLQPSVQSVDDDRPKKAA